MSTRQAVGLGRILLSAFAAIVAVMALSAAHASALTTHFFLETFGSAEQPEVHSPQSVTVDQSSGDVLVAQKFPDNVVRFKPDGTPDNFSALGTNVIDGLKGPGEKDCAEEAASCDLTPEGGLEIEPQQLAVDNSGGATDGNIYVTQNASRDLVYVFSSSGEYLGELTQYKEGADASGPLASFGFACAVAVGPDGAVYVGDEFHSEIHKYVPSSSLPTGADNVANFSYSTPCSLAAGTGPTAGFIFAVSNAQPGGLGSELAKIDTTTGEVKYVIGTQVKAASVDPATGDVYATTNLDNNFGQGHAGFAELDASGASSASVVATVEGAFNDVAVRGSNGHVFVSPAYGSRLEVYGPLETEAEVEILLAQEVSATRARVRGTVNPDGAAVTECKFEYGTVESGAFAESVPCEGSVPTDSSTHTVNAVISGLPADGAKYHYRLVVSNAQRTATSEAETFDLPLPILTGQPTTISQHTANVTGIVRPEGEQLTDCEFEYGPTTAYGSSAPCTPAAALVPADYGAHTVTGRLEGLEEFSTYHYRLTFSTAGVTRVGGDETFRTRGPSGLPDSRRYEQVSPVEKNGADVGASLSMAALDGNRLAFFSAGSFAGAPTALQAAGLHYLATRGPSGWSTESIMPAGGELAAREGYQAFSRDLSKGALVWPESNPQQGSLDPNAPVGENLYLREAGSGSFRLLNGTLDDAGDRPGAVIWGSADFAHLAIASHSPLTVDAPSAYEECDGIEATNDLGVCAYEWDEGTLRLASVLPNGEPTVGGPGSTGVGRACGYEHAISDDGSRLFFTSPSEPSKGGQLYAREDGTSTTLVSASERTLPGGLGGKIVDFQNAEAAHGNRVLFTTRNALVDADTDETNDLYLYDYTKPVGERLTLISKDENPNAPLGAEVDGGPAAADPCWGVVGASEDLKRVYFVADNQILSGEPEAAGPKLYLWDDTGASPEVSYLGTLEGTDSRVWQGSLTGEIFVQGQQSRLARISTDGRYLVFLSTAELTSFDNEGQKEVYRYDAATGSMQCASCSGDAMPAEGEISLEEGSPLFSQLIRNHVTTNVTDKGQVFFQTTRGLIPADSNGRRDVYEYENGQLSLISSGESPYDSSFLDATPSGSDVFFTTNDRLVGWDKDENVDAYDARVGGGFPEPPSTVGCEGDSCQPAPVPPNDATPSSSSFEGSGNVAEPRRRRCAKGKVRRHGRCISRHKHRKHARRNRPATRSHG